jgi:hypothetical protein
MFGRIENGFASLRAKDVDWFDFESCRTCLISSNPRGGQYPKQHGSPSGSSIIVIIIIADSLRA